MNIRKIDFLSKLALSLPMLVGLTLLASNAVANRLTLLDPLADDKPRITQVLAEPDGGFTVLLSSGQGQTFDAAGEPSRQFSSRWLATQGGTRTEGDVALRVGDKLILVRSEAIVLPDQEFTSESGWLPPCQVENLVAGGQVQVLFRSRMQGWSAVASEVDGAGGLWVRNLHGDELYRYAADCHLRQVPAVPEDIWPIAAHPQLAAAFFLTRDGELGLIDEQGVRWMQMLPSFHSHSRLAVLDSGQVLVAYVAQDLEPRLAAFSDSGQPLWKMLLEDYPRTFLSFAEGALIQIRDPVSGWAETQLLDAAGSPRWVVPFEFLPVSQPFHRAQARFASFIGFADGDWPAPELQQVITIDLETGDWRVTETGRYDRVMATLANGDLIVSPFQEDPGGGRPDADPAGELARADCLGRCAGTGTRA